MGFPKKISQLPIASSINDNDILVLVHDDVTSQITFDKLIFSADTNTFVTGTTLVGTTYTINENNGSSFITDFNTIVSGKVNTTLFDSYTATTETEIDSKLDITTFDTYTAGTVDNNTIITGTTLVGTDYTINENNGSSFTTNFESIVSGKVDTTLFDTYTANTETEIDSKLDITTFDNYTAGTVDANTFVTGGTLTGTNLILEKNNDVDASPIDLSALSGATFSWSDPVVTAGNTSGDCINELWVSTISGCSPVVIGPELIVNGKFTMNGDLDLCSGGTLNVSTISGCSPVTISALDNVNIVSINADIDVNTSRDLILQSGRSVRIPTLDTGKAPKSGDIIAAKDVNGNLEWVTPSTFTGNTSGDCINELWVSSISGCSPVNIGTGLEVEGGLTVEGSLSATTFFGDGSGLDGVQANIPFTTLTPGATVAWDFDVAGENTKLTPDSGATAPNQIVPTNFPNGAHGYLIIDASNTVDFKLPTNSLITNGLVTPSEGSETKYSYIYDGTTFYWSIENNLIVPVYSTWASTNLVSDYDPASYGGAGGDVPDGTTWINSYTNNNLIGDLTKDGDPDEIQFVLADIPSETPAHWEFEDANTNAAWHRPSNLSPTAFAGSWNGTVWLQNRGTTTTWQGLIDGESDDQDVMYIEDNRPTFQEGGLTSIYSNFPELINNSTTQNYNLADEWIYFSLSCDEAANTVTFVIGCQLTMDNANGSIEGYDGSLISIEADGTYVETVAATVSAIAWTSCAVGSADNNVWDFRGRMGQVAIYNTNISSAIQRENWERTRETYYIT